VPNLMEHTVSIDLAAAKPKGVSMAQLGIPVQESTVIKKGKLHELIQPLEDGQPGRRYQNIRITGVKTPVAGYECAKLFLQFEVFGDDNVPAGSNSGFALALTDGADTLQQLPAAPAFLPYPCHWYENQFVYELPVAVFDRMAQLQLMLQPDQVQPVGA